MTEADISLLKHLAEKVLGLEEFDATAYFGHPDGTYYIRNGELALMIEIEEDGQISYRNPFEDANDALMVLAKTPCGETVQIDHHATDGEWHVDLSGRSIAGAAKHESFCRAICLACAKATGWTE